MPATERLGGLKADALTLARWLALSEGRCPVADSLGNAAPVRLSPEVPDGERCQPARDSVGAGVGLPDGEMRAEPEQGRPEEGRVCGVNSKEKTT